MSRKLFGALFLLSLIWGGTFFFIKLLLHDDFGPWTIAFLRSFYGLIAVAVIMIVWRKPFGFRKIAWLPVAIMALLNTAIPWALTAFAETRLTSSMTSVLNATIPLWTMIIGVLFFHVVMKRLQWLGMGIAFVGLFILLGVNPVSIISVDLIGFLLMMASSSSYGFGSQLSKRLLKGMSLYQITFCTLFCSTLGSGSMAFLFEPIPYSHLLSLENIAVMMGLGVFGSGIAYLLFYYMVQKGGPEFATMATYLVPASAIVWGYTLLSEDVGWSLLTGLAFILTGVYCAGRKPSGQASSKVNSAQTS